MPRKRSNLFGFGKRARAGQTTAASRSSFSRLTGSSGDRAPTSGTGKTSSYRGVKIYPKGDGWTTSIDRDTIFDTKAEAQRFLRSWKRNPMKRKPNDVIDEGAMAGLDAYYATLDAPRTFVKAGLGFKDRIKHALLGKPRKRNQDDGDDLVAAAAKAGQSELAKLHKYALSSKDKDLSAAVAKRAHELGVKVGDLDGGGGIGSLFNSRKKRGRKNPADDSEHMYEKFHGRPSSGTLTVEEEVHEHEHLAALGVFVNLRVLTISGKEALIGMSKEQNAEMQFDETVADSDAVYLCSNEDGTQLYFVGGDQEVDLKAIGMEKYEKDDMIIGVLAEVTYRTEKKFDSFQLTDYYHQLGEETGDQPMLRYDPRSPHLYVTGGMYKIKKPLIGVSAGIEN